MSEKTLITSKNYNLKKLTGAIWIVGFVLSFIIYLAQTSSTKSYLERKFIGDMRDEIRGMGFIEFMFSSHNANGTQWYFIIPLVLFIVFGVIFYVAMSKISLTVSDKRVYGNALFGKRVDLPLDAISAVGTSILKGIAITSASGAIKFALIKNRDEIHDTISKLLIERQSKPVASTTIKQEIPQSNADELKKYKDLLDNGVISQEEFEAKKKQLLGL